MQRMLRTEVLPLKIICTMKVYFPMLNREKKSTRQETQIDVEFRLSKKAQCCKLLPKTPDNQGSTALMYSQPTLLHSSS